MPRRGCCGHRAGVSEEQDPEVLMTEGETMSGRETLSR